MVFNIPKCFIMFIKKKEYKTTITMIINLLLPLFYYSCFICSKGRQQQQQQKLKHPVVHNQIPSYAVGHIYTR